MTALVPAIKAIVRDEITAVRSLELGDIARYERELLEYIRTRHGDILKSIRETEKLEEDVESKLQEALDEFANVFAPSSGAGQTA